MKYLKKYRLIAVIPALSKKCCAKSETPFSVNMTSGLSAIISLQTLITCSSSSCNILVKSCKTQKCNKLIVTYWTI